MTLPRPCRIDGIDYPSRTAAAYAIGISQPAISKAIKTGRGKNIEEAPMTVVYRETAQTIRQRAERDAYVPRVRELTAAGHPIIRISRDIGRSTDFVRRVMSENGIEPATMDNTRSARIRVNLPPLPFRIPPAARDETKPRVPSHMVCGKPGPYERFVAALREVAA